MTPEQWIISKGWVKTAGYKIDLEALRDNSEDWDKLFIPKEDLSDFVEETDFWMHESWGEQAFDEVEDVVDFIENNSEDVYDDDEGDTNAKH
jgi:hypothetical protein